MPITLTRSLQPVIVAAVLLAGLVVAPGCASHKAERADLTAVDQSIQRKQFDQAVQQADAFLAKNPTGAGAPEALYLRGLALEQKVAPSPQESRANLQAARASYIEALSRRPHDELETRIRAALGNVAYFQDDYQTAISQFAVAVPKLEQNDTRAWSLYRMGLCQQRLGQFQQADQTFTMVQKQHPNTEPARRAKEHEGARAFYVQLVTFKTVASADKAAAALKREGVEPVRATSAQGYQQIRVGPVNSYAQAQSLKSRFADRYPDAIIIP
jgi:outer membrane protein assembly factor BamD (BamD/ComL family)